MYEKAFLAELKEYKVQSDYIISFYTLTVYQFTPVFRRRFFSYCFKKLIKVRRIVITTFITHIDHRITFILQ